MTRKISLKPSELKFTFTPSPGPGGQNVNKLATAVLLRFNVLLSSSLPEEVRERLIHLLGNKLTGQGDLLIRASRYRTQERNRQDALLRLDQLIQRALTPPKKRKKTRPTQASRQRRLQTKKLQGVKKKLRRNQAGE